MADCAVDDVVHDASAAMKTLEDSPLAALELLPFQVVVVATLSPSSGGGVPGGEGGRGEKSAMEHRWTIMTL